MIFSYPYKRFFFGLFCLKILSKKITTAFIISAGTQKKTPLGVKAKRGFLTK
jgi:hypothetical protein